MKNKQIKLSRGPGYCVFGVSVQAFGRIGLEDCFSDFAIVCLNYSGEIETMRQEGVGIFCLEEHLGEKPKGRRNPTTLLENKAARDFIKKHAAGRKPVLVLYKSSSKIEALAKKHGWIVAANPYNLRMKLENKVFFRRMAEKIGLEQIQGDVMTFGELNYQKLKAKFKGAFVMQGSIGGGGGGTGFIHSEKDFKRTLKKFKQDLGLGTKDQVVASRFIKGYSPSITGCVAGKWALQLYPQLQLIDVKELHPEAKGNGVFCGHDWWEARNIPRATIKQMRETVEKIGNYLKKHRYRGIFGVDFLVDEKTGQAWAVEMNPRLLGTYPISTLIQQRRGELPLIILHLLEFILRNRSGDNTEETGFDLELKRADIEKLNRAYGEPKQGAHFFISAPFKPCVLKNGINSGVFELEKGRLKFKRPGFKLRHLKTETEFLLVDGVPCKGREIMDDGPLRIMRVVCLGKISQNMGRELNDFGRNIIRAVYDALEIQKPV
ncbi:MAG: ATP-grasp domain-containing protein [Patescibacteria group bacterium]|nr:ATP-grasp domain-containing protein [Patescibacteria group bacterium]